MIKKIFGVIISLFLIFTFFSGCIEDEKTEEEKFFGTWKSEDGLTLIINSTESCMFYGDTGTWHLDGDVINITLTFTGGKNKMSFNYEFSDDLNTLTLTDKSGRFWVFEKQ